MVNNTKKALINISAQIIKILGDNISKFRIELNGYSIDMFTPEGTEVLNHEYMEPLVEYFIKNDINWRLGIVTYTSGTKGFKLNIWK